MGRRWLNVLALLVLGFAAAFAQEEKKNQLDMNLNMLGRGEMRFGGFTDGAEENRAQFLLGRTRLSLDYKRPHIEAKVTAQHGGVWGQADRGGFNLHEAWAKLSTKNGLFAQMGRQVLSYDDERIIGANDWAMAANSHDVLKLGYEGYGHKVHAILGFNQNGENVSGGTYYSGNSYKVMHTLWYHYDVPKIPIGASLLFMNIGMQGEEMKEKGKKEPCNRYQQLLGGYLSYKPGRFTAEASYYHQLGRDENNAKIDAWMASIKAQMQITKQVGVLTGFDYLSGDEYFAVPPKGMLGVVRHEYIGGFSPVYGSHHKFYGMMDFFYVQAYLNGFSPGLQNLYGGATYRPVKGLSLSATYHYMAMATTLEGINKTLGHNIDIEASYQVLRDAQVSLGFSYMTGSETMEKLKRAEADNNLKWAWFSLVVSPRIFSTKW